MANVYYGECPPWRMSTMENIHHGECLPWRMSTMANVYHGERLLYNYIPPSVFEFCDLEIDRKMIGEGLFCWNNCSPGLACQPLLCFSVLFLCFLIESGPDQNNMVYLKRKKILSLTKLRFTPMCSAIPPMYSFQHLQNIYTVYTQNIYINIHYIQEKSAVSYHMLKLLAGFDIYSYSKPRVRTLTVIDQLFHARTQSSDGGELAGWPEHGERKLFVLSRLPV